MSIKCCTMSHAPRATRYMAVGSWRAGKCGGRWSSKWQFVKIFAININYAHKVKSLAAFRLIINALGAKQKRERERKRREWRQTVRGCSLFAACNNSAGAPLCAAPPNAAVGISIAPTRMCLWGYERRVSFAASLNWHLWRTHSTQHMHVAHPCGTPTHTDTHMQNSGLSGCGTNSNRNCNCDSRVAQPDSIGKIKVAVKWSRTVGGASDSDSNGNGNSNSATCWPVLWVCAWLRA